ncbi:MAG TPA: lysylphosphatidylglycerol synthase domain-containing protein, partial [Cryptosporangiaceae bacterium]|nr:lysylphosphatidylglycerol synthase domain-containing protein [Cryptosporangiaceae bacterium]
MTDLDAPRPVRRRIDLVRLARALVGVIVLVIAVGYLWRVVDAGVLGGTVGAVLAAPLGLAAALVAYAAAFWLRAWSWRAVLPGLSVGQAWAALHVSLLGNHVLPFRLGEALRVTSVLRRTRLPARPVLASAVTLRAADLLAVLALASVAAPGLIGTLAGAWVWAGVALLAMVCGAGLGWSAWLRRSGAAVRLPGVRVGLAALAAWALESAVVWEIAQVAGYPITPYQAVAVTAVT